MMSQPASHGNQSGNDSDTTFCAEAEEKWSRSRKKTNFYQMKSDFIERMERKVEMAIKRNDSSEKVNGLLNVLSQFKAKNKRDQDDASQLTEKLQNLVIGNEPPYRNNQRKRYRKRSLKKHSCRNSYKSSFHSKTSADNRYDASQELAPHVSCSRANQFLSDVFNTFDSGINATLTTNINDEDGQESQLEFGSTNTNQALNTTYEHSQLNCKHLNTHETSNLDASKAFESQFKDSSASKTLNSINNSASLFNCSKDGDSHSCSVTYQPEQPKGQQLMDKNLMLKSFDSTPTLIPTSQSLHGLQCSTKGNSANQTKLNLTKTMACKTKKTIRRRTRRITPVYPKKKNGAQSKVQATLLDFLGNKSENKKGSELRETNILIDKTRATQGSGCKATKRKTPLTHKKKSVAQPVTQTTLFEFLENKTEDKENSKLQEINVLKDEASLELEKAEELMATFKRNFLMRLKMRKREILEARAAARVSKTESQESSLYLSYCSEKNVIVKTDDPKSNDSEEILENIKDLFEISARYREMYKNKKIDLLSDEEN